jgi:hypothetical protein
MATKHIKISPKVTDPSMKNKQVEQVLEEPDVDMKELIFDSPQKTKEEEAFFSYDNKFLVIVFAVAIVALFLIVIYMYYKSDDKEKEEEMLKNKVLLPDYQNQQFDFMQKAMPYADRNETQHNEKESKPENAVENAYYSNFRNTDSVQPNKEEQNNFVKPKNFTKNEEQNDVIKLKNLTQSKNEVKVNNESSPDKEDNVDSSEIKNEVEENKKPVVLNTANEVDEILKITSKLV